MKNLQSLISLQGCSGRNVGQSAAKHGNDTTTTRQRHGNGLHLSRIVTLLLLLLTIGVGQMWGIGFNKGNVIFRAQGWNNPTHVYLCIGKSDYTSVYEMSRISNTDLYHVWVNVDENDNNWWNGCTYFAVIGSSSTVSSGSWGNSSLSTKGTKGYTAAYTSAYDINNSDGCYFFNKNNSTVNGGSFTITYTSYGSITKYNAIQKAKKRDTGTSYSDVSGSYPASIKLKGTYLTGNAASGQTTITSTTSTDGSGNTTYGTVATGEVTHSYASLSSNYYFEGWGTSATPSNTNSTYTYKITANTTVYAFFSKKYTLNYGKQGTSGSSTLGVSVANYGGATSSGSSIPTGRQITFTATPAAGYAIEGWFSDEDCTESLNNGQNTTYTISTLDANTNVYCKFAAVKDISVYIYVGDCSSDQINSLVLTGTPYVGDLSLSGVTKYIGDFTTDGNWRKYTFTNVSGVYNLAVAGMAGAQPMANVSNATESVYYRMFDGTVLPGKCIARSNPTWGTTPVSGIIGNTMTASVSGAPVGATITWTSTNTTAATVTSAGVISYEAVGATTIKANVSWDADGDYCAGEIELSQAISVTSGASVSATRTSSEYVAAGVGGQVTLSITSSGASTGWKYRIYNGTGYESPDNVNAASNSAVWTMTGGIPTGTNTYTVQLYDNGGNLITSSSSVSVIGETAYSTTVSAGDNGSVSPSGTVYANNNHVTPTITATPNANYHFVNWTTNNAAATVADATDDETTLSATAGGYTITAHFAGDEYTITYKDQSNTTFSGVHSAGFPTKHTYGTATDLDTPTKSGYAFAGWFIDASCTVSAGSTLGATAFSDDITLYAKWIGFSSITVVPSTEHTGADADTIVVGDALTITPTVSNAPLTHTICAKALYKKEEGQWVEQDITISSNGAGGFTITGTPLAGSKPLPAGEYKVALTLRNGSTCEAAAIVTAEKVFYVGEQGWYIYGGAFYDWSSSKADIPETRLFLPTSTSGQYYFGPWKFTNDGGGNYQYFRIYNKIDDKDYFATSVGDFSLTSSFNSEATGVTLLAGTHSNSFKCTLSDKNYYLYIQNGKMWITSTRPALAPKVRFYVSGDGGTSKYYSGEVTLSNGNARRTSFYHPGGTVTFTKEQFVLGTGWTSSSLTYDNLTDITTSIASGNKGVYVVDLTWDSSNDRVAISNVEKYNGNYYIRTDHSPGQWNNYDQAGNLFTYSDYTKEKEGYTHYFMKWVEGENDAARNVKFDVANEYNSSLSKNQAGFGEDTYANNYGQLKQNANVRFMYSEIDNTLSRAYLSGSALQSDYFLVLKGDHSSGYHLYTKEDKSAEHKTNGTSDWAFFSDNKNWVYQVEVYATPGTRIKLTAQVKNKSNVNATQFFKGKDGAFTDANTEPLIGGSGSTAYKMMVVYDFKTNRLISAWEPSGTISGHIEDVDVMLERHGQEAATQIKFADGDGNDLTAKNIIGAIRFDYNEMKGRISGWNESTRPFLMYFISFPFDVNVSDIFGLNGTYGEAYIIQKYDGAERAEKGFFRGDGTTTFWKKMGQTEKMDKNTGYCLVLDDEYFNGTKGHIWDDKVAGTSVYLYFPSTGDVGLINGTSETINVPEHKCNIDRSYINGMKSYNHKNTDSNWNLIGIPVFGNTLGTASGTPGDVFLAEYDDEQQFRYYYGWKPDNKFYIANAADTTFKAMHSYMVQYTGDITFTGSSPVASVAARRTASTGKYNIELRVLSSDKKMLNRTYVELREEACDTFALNEDVYMSYNTNAVNIYTFAGGYDVAANVLSIANHTIPVGLEVLTAGTYTISMPSTFRGTVTLIDKETGTRTNLAISDYEVTLPKGVVDNRFLLEISDISHVITDIEYTTGEGSLKDGKPHKFVKNGLLYIIRDGKMYDARGARVE